MDNLTNKEIGLNVQGLRKVYKSRLALMDFNIFEGMRTFAANIAVELPESEVDSSHYRILFLAALVLFTFTFVINTVAEVVRQRLRERYGSL